MRLRCATQVFAAAVISLGACAAVSLAAPAAGGSASPTCGAPIAKADGGNWTCTFDDEFSGRSLNPDRWTVLTSAAVGLGGASTCFTDSSQNVAVRHGMLALTALRRSYPVTCHTHNGEVPTRYTGGDVATIDAFAQTGGRFSIRARFDSAGAAGVHSALWLWPQDLFATQLTGEIDIAEKYSVYPDRAIPYLHYPFDPATVNAGTATNIVTNNYCLIDSPWAFHEYTAEWTPTRITILFDGTPCLVDNYVALGPSPFAQDFFVALTQTFGVGTNSPTAATRPRTTMQVDWVRAWN